tara:strand:- start:84771 stop:85427 length:657 start_codon:yes stop_codon:yes gene_type:complete
MENGKKGFSKDYWDKNYSSPKDMDGIGNAKLHAKYLASFFELEQVEIKSIVDLGFGLGFLSHAVLKKFKPWRFNGIEPSIHAYDKGSVRIRKCEETKIKLECQSLDQWAKAQVSGARWFDLCLCTSVWQYLSEEELIQVVPTLSRMCRYLYLTVPTDKELDKQINHLDFYDDLAIRRPRQFYLDLLKPHFTLVSSRIWESKVHFNEDNTQLSELIYRI